MVSSSRLAAVLALPFGSSAITASSSQAALEKEWARELDSDEEGTAPIKRVIGLIQKMKSELEAEASKEAEMYDKMVCWCETGEKEKTKAIADAEAAMDDLQTEIEERSAKIGSLAANIAKTKEEIAENTAALNQAEKIRENEAAEFRGSEKDLIQATANLRNAVAVLEKVQFVQGQKSFLQLGAPLLSSLRVVLRDAALKRETLLAARSSQKAFVQLSSDDHKDLLEAMDEGFGPAGEDALPLKFAQQMVEKSAASGRASSFLQVSSATAPAAVSYSSQSNGIFGIMTQMLEEFQSDLSEKQKNEERAIADFKALKAAKEEQLTVAKEKLDTMESDGAGNLKALSDAKENLDLTQNQRSADVKYLRNLKLTCDDLDAQWAKRSQNRAAEMKAVSETLVILTEDDHHEQLKKGGVSLLQASTATTRHRRSLAVAALRRASQQPSFDAEDLLAAWHGRSASRIGVQAGPRAQLSTLAMSVQLDSFTKVKEMMDKLVADLKNQQAEEVEFKAYCQKEFAENEKAVFAKNEVKEDLETRMDELASMMKKLAGEIADARQQIADTQLEMKKASEGREGENAEFQTVVADQRATQDILKKALTRLQDFYVKGKGKAAAFAQEQQTPPVHFNEQKDNAGASPVMGLIEQIIEDSVALVKESTENEYKAQADYEVMIKDSNALIKELTTAVTEKTKASAAAKKEAGQAKSDHTSAVGELESLADYEADLHVQCDFVLKNFAIRQKARLQEIEAIQQAKGILSGA